MKAIKNISIVIILILCFSVQAQDFSLAVSYLHGEKSKDSHSSQENISVSGTNAAYSVKFSGRKGKNDVDMDKVCEFTEQDIKNIKKTIVAKGLNVNDSLFQQTSKTKSYEVYTNISIAIVMDGQEYKIRINGDVIEFDESDLYKNAVFFITMLRKMSKDC